MHRSPTLEAFRLLVRWPSFGLTEIAWRWSIGGCALLLCISALAEYFASLAVSPADMFLLRTHQPALISQALLHIFQGSGGRLASGLLIVFVTLSAAWVVVASLGRAATLRALSDHFQNHAFPRTGFGGQGFRSLLGLNFLRAAVLLATLIGSLAALGLGGLAASKDPLAIRTATQFSMALLLFVWGAGYLLNWFLSLASVFAVWPGAGVPTAKYSPAARRQGPGAAILAALNFCQHQFVAVLTINTWFGFARLAAAATAGTILLIPLSLASLLPQKLILTTALLITLFYFALADCLSVGKLAAYIGLLHSSAAEVQLPTPAVSCPPSASIDRDELILSDLPLLPDPGSP